MLTMWGSHTKLVPGDELLTVHKAARRAGRVVVWTNGTFDLPHPGHVSSLQAARALGDVLAVGAAPETACRLASLAAAVVVGKVGTATCSLSGL
jgi:cytidyltransferase-like protein